MNSVLLGNFMNSVSYHRSPVAWRRRPTSGQFENSSIMLHWQVAFRVNNLNISLWPELSHCGGNWAAKFSSRNPLVLIVAHMFPLGIAVIHIDGTSVGLYCGKISN